MGTQGPEDLQTKRFEGGDLLDEASDLAAAARRGEALAFLSSDMRRLLWATPAGFALFGAEGPGPKPLDGRLPIERFSELLRGGAPAEGFHLERIRMPGRRFEPVTLGFRRVRIAEGAALAVLSPEPVGPATALPAWIFATSSPDKSPAAPAVPVTAAEPAARAVETPGTDIAAPQAEAPERDEAAVGRDASPRSVVGPLRFTWRTDAEGRFERLPDDKRGQSSPSAATAQGRGPAATRQDILDSDGAFAAALARRETFNAVRALWRTGPDLRPVRLGGTPVFGPDDRFEGFRGFGVVESAVPASRAPEIGVEAPRRIAEPVTRTPVEAPRVSAAVVAPSSMREAAAPVGRETVRHPAPVARPAPDASGRGALSAVEKAAFREIARALGAVMDEDRPAPPPPPAAAAPPSVPDPSPPVRAPSPIPAAAAATAGPDLLREALDVFDRLTLGVMLSRGDVPILMNRALLDMLGYPDADAFHAEGGMDRLFRGPSPETDGGRAMRVEGRDGREFPAHVRLNTVTWGGMPATLTAFRPVDADPERAAALERELAERDREIRELSDMLDVATDGVLVIDADGRIAAANRTAEALFGYEESRLLGEKFLTVIAPESHASALEYFDAMKSNGVLSLLNDGRDVNGRVRKGGTIPLFMTFGRIGGDAKPRFCAVLRDMTAWKRAEADLLASKQKAEKANAQKSDVLATISHELRTPLSAVMGFAEVMIEERFGPVGNERYKDYLRDIHASGAHVLSLVNDLLDLAKIEAGKFDLDFRAVDPNALVAGAVNLLQPQAQSGKVVLRSGLAPTLPMVVADERSLRQIVLNLLSNAVKFTDPGGQVIVSTAFTDAGEVVIRVRDTGVGMDASEIEAAFEPFRQTRAGKRAGGTGLGLPLTKALVEANRATLDIRSARDQGTMVEVVFPTNRVLVD